MKQKRGNMKENFNETLDEQDEFDLDIDELDLDM
jgi:hypothetical protein